MIDVAKCGACSRLRSRRIVRSARNRKPLTSPPLAQYNGLTSSVLSAIAPGYWFFAAALVVIGVAALPSQIQRTP
jgi:hypothetical protein